MYRINLETNTITPIPAKSFSSLGLSERKHLQEWLAHHPEALDPDVLIIQKEFDGFDDTKERLDLLGIDRDGNLVIIENKLDDSGRDVIWQALKYASYCSGLNKDDVINIFQKYLEKQNSTQKAEDALLEFFNIQDLSEKQINPGTHQRLIFVAANFRKEVTSAALWLLSNGIRLQCFKVTPYSLEKQLFLDVEQIIPTPEAEEFMIGIRKKEVEQSQSESKNKERHQIRYKFWIQALEKFQNSQCTLFNNISPSKDHWLSAGSGVSGIHYTLIFGNKFIRVELSIEGSDQEENKFIFDQLKLEQNHFDTTFGSHLNWMRLDDKKTSRICKQYDIDGYDEENWPLMTQWMMEHMSMLDKTFGKKLPDVNKKMKQMLGKN